jgi:hypothetical protein
MALQRYPQLKKVDQETVINALNGAYEDYLMHYGYEGIGPDEESSMIDHAVKGLKQGLAEGSRKAWMKHNDLVDIEKPLAGLKAEFNNLLRTHDPEEKAKYQQGIKQRIKAEPMSGPKGQLPEQDVAEEKVRLDPHCWSNKKIGKPKTKVKGGVRVNNCVPKESAHESRGRRVTRSGPNETAVKEQN